LMLSIKLMIYMIMWVSLVLFFSPQSKQFLTGTNTYEFTETLYSTIVPIKQCAVVDLQKQQMFIDHIHNTTPSGAMPNSYASSIKCNPVF